MHPTTSPVAPDPQPWLMGGRVTLRPFEPADVPDVRLACSDEQTQRWLPLPRPYDDAAASGFVEGFAPQQWQQGTGAEFAVVTNTDGRLAGAIGLKRIDRQVGSGEVGYWTGPWARGKGLTAEAVRVLVRWAFGGIGLRRVELRAAPGNAPSLGVARRAGFVEEGVLRQAGWTHDGPVDLVVLSRLVSDPEPRL